MSLNIKNPRVHELAREAARRLGMSQTSVIEEALVRLLASLDEASEVTRQDRVLEILGEVDLRLTGEQRATLIAAADGLYDEVGLPA